MTTALRARLGLLQICLAGVLWGTGGLAVQLVRERVPLSSLTISGWRVALAALALLVAIVALGRARAVVGVLRAEPARVAAVGLATALYQVLYFASVVWVGVTVSTVVSLGLAPVMLAAWHAVQARRRPGSASTAPGAWPVTAALAGLVLVSAAGHGGAATGSHPMAGVLAAIGSGTGYAVATALAEPLSRRTNPLALTAASTACGALVLVPVAAVAAAAQGSPVLVDDPASLGLLVYLGVLTFALAYGLLYAGLRTTPSSAAVLATLVEPVTAALVAAAVLGERVGPAGMLGIVLVLAAVAALALRPAPTGATSSSAPR